MRILLILFFSVLLLSLLTIKCGYQFGCSDQVELLPYSFYLKHQNYYPRDFFIQGLHNAQPNERTVMAHLLMPFIDNIELWNPVFHVTTSIVLLSGLMLCAEMLIGNFFLAALATAVSLIMLYDFGIGNNEVWTAAFQASNVASAIIAWSFYFFIKSNLSITFLLLAVATIIHPLEGLTVFSAVFFYSCWHWSKTKKIKLKELSSLSFYLLSAGSFMLMLYLQKDGGINRSHNSLVFEILFRFRHPHHFILQSFPLVKIISTFVFGTIAVIVFRKKNLPIAFWTLFSVAGMIFYAFATDVLNFIPIANFQFYKTAQWVKFFGIVAAINWFANEMQTHYTKSRLKWITAATFVAISLYASKNFLKNKLKLSSVLLSCNNEMVEICQQIERETPIDAVFVQPFDNTELKWFGKRSSYVEFKANVRHPKMVMEWYKRINEVYGVSIGDRKKGFELTEKANNNFKNLSENSLRKLKNEGVTHLLTFAPAKVHFGKLILKNKSYAVYQL